MGGICGVFHPDGGPVPPGLIDGMAARLAHRGTGRTWTGPGAAFWATGDGLAAGAGGLTVAWDGDVYNADELGGASGRTDAELAAGLAAEGVESLSRINGDLAAAVHDPRTAALHLWRDRFGVRPLYYTRIGPLLLFASEVKAFWAHADFEPRINVETLYDFLATHYRYIHRDPERTYFQGVFQVPAGYRLEVHAGTTAPRRHWQLTLDPDAAALPVDEAAEALLELFTDSVRRRIADDPKAAFSVSSGMDSSSVAASAGRLLNRRLPLYSVGYAAGADYDEAAGIAPLARQWGDPWRNLILDRPPLVDMVSDLSRVHDAPLCTVTWLSHHHLVQNAAEDGCLVVFSGLGGDEGLAGEYEHFLYFFADLKAQGREERLEAEIDAWARLHDHPVFKKNRRVVEDAFRRLVDLDRPGRTFIDRDRYFADQDAFDPDFLAQGPPPPEPDCPFESYLANRCYQDLVYETTPPSLDADAKNTGAHGLVSRFPFLDHRLVSFCYSLAPTVKYDHGATKAVMRRAMTGRLPEANRTNLVKTGFNAPLNQWLLTDQRRDFLDLMRSRSFQQRGWLKPGAFDRLWQEHQSGQKNHMMLFWQLLSAELWLRTLAD